MGMEKFYNLVRKKLGLDKEEMKKEVTNELKQEFGEEISYIEAQMKEYEQLVAEINHLLSIMRKNRIQTDKNGDKIKMDNLDDIEPLKSKLKELERSMKKRMNENSALG